MSKPGKIKPAGWVYVGPDYHLGIETPHPRPRLVRPAELSQEEIEALMAEYPQLADWYTKASDVVAASDVPDADSTNL